MPNFTEHLLTNGGRALIAQAHLGRKLTFTKIAVGSGNQPNPAQATALAAHRMDVEITSIQRDATNANWVRVRGMFTNASLATGFAYREMGLFARIDSDPEVLYSYVADAGAGDLIPAYDGANPVIIYPTMIIIIESTIPIHADITIGGDVDAANIGTSTVEGWFAQKVGNILEFKRPVAGSGIELTEDASTITIGQRILHIDLELYVPTSHPDAPRPNVAFPTIQAAWDSLRDIGIPAGRQATIHVDEGRFTMTAALRLEHPNADRISIIGKPPVTIPWVSGPTIWEGVSANRYFRVNLSNVTGLQVGDVIAFTGTGNVTYSGAFRVGDITGNQIVVSAYAPGRGATPTPNATLSGATFIRYRTQLINVTDSEGIIFLSPPGLGLLKNIAVRGILDSASQILLSALKNPASINIQDCAFVGGFRQINGQGSGSNYELTRCNFGDARRSSVSVSAGASASLSEIVVTLCGYRGIWAFGASITLGSVVVTHSLDAGICADAGGTITTGADGIMCQNNARGFAAAGGGSVCRIAGPGWTNQNATADLHASGASTILVSGEYGYMNFGTASPPQNTVGNQNSIVIR